MGQLHSKSKGNLEVLEGTIRVNNVGVQNPIVTHINVEQRFPLIFDPAINQDSENFKICLKNYNLDPKWILRDILLENSYKRRSDFDSSVLDIILAFSKLGVDILCFNENINFFLDIARYNFQAFQYLVKHRAFNKCTLMNKHRFCMLIKSHFEILELLVQNYVIDINYRIEHRQLNRIDSPNNVYTYLHGAMQNTDKFNAILRIGGLDLSITNSQGKNVLEFAFDQNSKLCCSLINYQLLVDPENLAKSITRYLRAKLKYISYTFICFEEDKKIEELLNFLNAKFIYNIKDYLGRIDGKSFSLWPEKKRFHEIDLSLDFIYSIMHHAQANPLYLEMHIERLKDMIESIRSARLNNHSFDRITEIDLVKMQLKKPRIHHFFTDVSFLNHSQNDVNTDGPKTYIRQVVNSIY